MPEYENSQKAVDYAIDYVFGKTSFYDHHFAESISFNQHKNLSKMEFKNIVENLKNHYEEITLGHTKATGLHHKGNALRSSWILRSGNY
jgi:hypothetical protein